MNGGEAMEIDSPKKNPFFFAVKIGEENQKKGRGGGHPSLFLSFKILLPVLDYFLFGRKQVFFLNPFEIIFPDLGI